jgi:large subunit ribosomal protein L1
VRVAVIAKGDKAAEAQKAGAEIVGSDDLVAKIAGGFLDFDVLITTPDMMGAAGKLGKVLGPKGLMPSPKSGTVTQDVEKCIKEFKSGKLEFKVDKLGGIHLSVGKISFGKDRLLKNLKTVIGAILLAKPNSVKANYLKGISVAVTMGPGIKLSPTKVGQEI